MFKSLLICVMVLVSCVTANAAIKAAFTSANATDQLVTSSNIVLLDATVYFKGATVGDAIVLKNGTTSAGTPFLTVVTAAANGTYIFSPSEPIQIDGGIYMDGAMATGTTTSGATLMFQ